MFSTRLKEIRETDVSKWISGSTKISLRDVCLKFDVDIENDRRNRFFYQIQLDQSVIVTDELLDWLGYSGGIYSQKKHAFGKLLEKNPHMEFQQLADQNDPRKKYYVLNAIDFESLMMQMRTPKAVELRQLFSLMKHILIKYWEFEKLYEKLSADIVRQENSALTNSITELKGLLLSARESREIEFKKADEARRIAEEQARRADEERRLAQEERVLAQKARILAEESQRQEREEKERLRNLVVENNSLLRNVIAPNVVPKVVSRQKMHRFGVYRTPSGSYEWYLMRRQVDGWKGAEKILTGQRFMKKVAHWDNVSHAIDVGNALKKRCRELLWSAKGNTISVKEAYPTKTNDAVLVSMIDDILRQKNAANFLADQNENHLKF